MSQGRTGSSLEPQLRLEFPNPELPADPPHFDGATYEPEHDRARLTTLLERVRSYMLATGSWKTLDEIADVVGSRSSASVSARLRDLRKWKFGAFEVDRRRRGDPADGLYEYRVRVPDGPDGL